MRLPEWKKPKFPDVVFFQEGPGLRKWQWTDDGMKVINVTNIIGDGSIDTSNTSRFISIEEFHSRYRHFAIDPGDILLASSGNTYGKLGRVGAQQLPIMMNTSVIRLHSADKTLLSDDFLYAYLRSPDFKNQVEAFVTGSAQPNFGPSHIKRMELPLPPLLIQRRIASILGAYDDLIEVNRRRIAVLEEMARRLFDEWFVNFRFPGYEGHTVVETENGKLPLGWNWESLERVCTQRDGIQTGPFGSQLHQSDYTTEGVPVTMPKNLVGLKIVTADIARIPEAIADSLGRHRMRAGDVVYGRRGDIGRRAYVSARENGWFCGTGCLRLRPDTNRIAPRYFFDALGLHNTEGSIKGRAQGATMPNLSAKAMVGVPVLVPPITLQLRYASLADSTAAQVATLVEANAKLAESRDLLLPRLISGELSVATAERELHEAA